MSDDPVKLRDLIQSLASTMVVTSHFLDQSTVDLQNLYAHSGSSALAGMTPPRFALDEITVDLSFVVEEAKVVSPTGREPQAPQPMTTLTDNQEDRLRELLGKLQGYEADLALFEKRRARFAAEQQRLAGQDAAAARQIVTLQAQLGNPFVPNRQELRRRIEELQANRKEIAAQRQALEEPEKPANPEQFPVEKAPPKLLDYVGLWVGFEERYARLKEQYAEAVKAFKADEALPRIERHERLPDEVRKAMDTAGVAPTTKQKVDAMREDFEKTEAALGDLTSLVAELKGAGIKVRVDPKSISEAAEAARQRLRLTFRAESQETVKVEGEEVDIVR